jgi:hypothetical protein
MHLFTHFICDLSTTLAPLSRTRDLLAPRRGSISPGFSFRTLLNSSNQQKPRPARIDPLRLQRSMTTSPIGCEQQTRRLPSAGISSGSGP